MTDVDAINFFRDAAMIADPYAYYEALRSECPVRRETRHDVVMVTGYEEATAILNDADRFSSCASVSGPFPGFPVPLTGDDVSDLISEHRHALPMSDQIITFDPPTHTDHRALMMRLITPKRLKENEAFIWRLADRQIDTFANSGRCEYIGEYASPLAMLVIADLLGVPEQDHVQFEQALLQRPSGGGVGSTTDRPMAHSPLEYLYERFSEYIEDRRRSPRNDVLTGLASATFPDGSVPEVIDVVRIAANIFAAGQETTVRLLGSAVLKLAEDQELQSLLRRRRELIPNFIEECLRVESPIKGDFRLSKVPTTIGGIDIPAGTTLMLLLAAANRDPRRFDDPATFDVHRANARQHISFGRGAHTCPGSPLARAEASVSIARLFDRTSEFHISESDHGPAGARRYSYVPTFILRGLTALHIEFSTASGTAP